MDGRTESPARARANGDSDGSPQSLRQRSQRGIRKKNLGVNRGQSLGSGTCRHHHAAPGGRVRCTHRRRARAWSQASQVPPVTLQPLGLRYAAAGVCLAVVVLGRVSRRLQAFGPQAATLIRYSYVAVHGGLRCRGKARAREPSICLLRGGGEATESLWAPLALGGTTRGYVPGDPQPTTARPSAARVDSLSKPVPFLAPPQFFSLSPQVHPPAGAEFISLDCPVLPLPPSSISKSPLNPLSLFSEERQLQPSTCLLPSSRRSWACR